MKIKLYLFKAKLVRQLIEVGHAYCQQITTPTGSQRDGAEASIFCFNTTASLAMSKSLN